MRGPSRAGFATRKWPLHESTGWLLSASKKTIPVFGAPDFQLERKRALTGGNDGGPVNEHALNNVELLDQVC
eukprot:COSAG01_NODE_6182_length_3805_cov_3.174852_1_plen_71_part_10